MLYYGPVLGGIITQKVQGGIWVCKGYWFVVAAWGLKSGCSWKDRAAWFLFTYKVLLMKFSLRSIKLILVFLQTTPVF